jgi:spermidine/putrescine ABC transporter ATP-binding subunit
VGASLRIERLRKTYGELVAVDDVTLAVAAGEFVTLLGPSGSGKTTTLMMIAGFVAPTSGEIHIGERAIARIPPEERELGMVFQSYALFPHMTVAENIGFPLKMRHWPKADAARRIAAALEMVRLQGYDARYPRQLSGGQQRRVALARAIVFEPRVLLMDEPLGSLDKKLRGEMQAEIKRIQRALGITVIYVTHDQEEALTMSDRIVVMRLGRIEQVGSPAVLYEEPANAFVADFVGESNFVGGTVVRTADRVAEVKHESGRLFRATMRDGVVAGAAVMASVRPERLVLAPENRVAADDNRWTGRLAEIVYVGDSIKYRIALDETVLTVKAQNRGLAVQARVGDMVEVSWSPAHTMLLQGGGEYATSRQRSAPSPLEEEGWGGGLAR